MKIPILDSRDVVVDIFAGSNTTGATAEALDRRWLAFELDQPYLAASVFRFVGDLGDQEARELYRDLTSQQPRETRIASSISLQQALM